MSLVMYCALPNTKDNDAPDELLACLKASTKGVDFYQRIPKPGTISSAAFDWEALINLTASSFAIANAIWAAYKKFVKPLIEVGDEEAELFIALDDNSEQATSFALGRVPTNKNDFIIEFTETIERMRNSQGVEESEKVERKFKVSSHYKKI